MPQNPEYTALDKKVPSLTLHCCPALPRLAHSDCSYAQTEEKEKVTKLKFEYNTQIYVFFFKKSI